MNGEFKQAEQYRCVALSTAHIKKVDLMALDRQSEDEQMVLVRDTGYFIKLYEEEDYNCHSSYSLRLNVLIRKAHMAGFRMIELDRDAPILDNFPSSEW